MIVFHPESCPWQVWIITERYVTVVNNNTGTSATLPMAAFITELHKRGYYERVGK